jgi:hypothetical protein
MSTVDVTEARSRQPGFRMEYQEHQSRLTTFFRLITAIPAALLLSVWGLAVYVTVVVAWFALLFTGRYPQGLYDFHASFCRYATYAYGYLFLATDRWPGFSGSPDVGYPVQLLLGPPLPAYERLKVLFRLILAIPPALIAYAMNLVASIAAFVAWFAIVFTGRLPEGIYQMLHLGLSYQQRALPYFLLLTENWPSFTVEGDREALAVTAGDLPPAPEAPAAPGAGAAPGAPAVSGDEAPGGFAPPQPPPR